LIVLDENTKNATGLCSNNNNTISYLSINLEKDTYLFLFNKTSMNEDIFNYEMFDFHMEYNTDSKYFPNHAYGTYLFVNRTFLRSGAVFFNAGCNEQVFSKP